MKQDVVDGFRSAMVSGKSREDVIADMKRGGLTIVDAIKATRELFSIGLGEAKNLISQHPDYADLAGAAAPFQEALLQSFEDVASEKLDNH